MKSMTGSKRNDREYSNNLRLLYNGAEPAYSIKGISKEIARAKFHSLPQDKKDRIALAFEFMTVSKGWDILG